MGTTSLAQGKYDRESIEWKWQVRPPIQAENKHFYCENSSR